MMTPHLKDVWREPEFWLLLVVSLPGLAFTMTTAAHATLDAVNGNPITYDPSDAIVSLMGLPIVAYLALGRQVARRGAAEGVGYMLGQGAGDPDRMLASPDVTDEEIEVDGIDETPDAETQLKIEEIDARGEQA